MLKLVTVFQPVSFSKEHLIKVQLEYALIEKLCSSREDAMSYLKELMNNFDVKAYTVSPIEE